MKQNNSGYIIDNMLYMKRKIRRLMRAYIQTLGIMDKIYYSNKICANLKSMLCIDSYPVLLYFSNGWEPYLDSLIYESIIANFVVCVPKVQDNKIIIVRIGADETYTLNKWGIVEPKNSTPFLGTVRTVIVPGLAFSTDGMRLGYGGGFYDRWLADNQYNQAIGVCYPSQLWSKLPQQSRDRGVSTIMSGSYKYHINN